MLIDRRTHGPLALRLLGGQKLKAMWLETAIAYEAARRGGETNLTRFWQDSFATTCLVSADS